MQTHTNRTAHAIAVTKPKKSRRLWKCKTTCNEQMVKVCDDVIHWFIWYLLLYAWCAFEKSFRNGRFCVVDDAIAFYAYIVLLSFFQQLLLYVHVCALVFLVFSHFSHFTIQFGKRNEWLLWHVWHKYCLNIVNTHCVSVPFPHWGCCCRRTRCRYTLKNEPIWEITIFCNATQSHTRMWPNTEKHKSSWISLFINHLDWITRTELNDHPAAMYSLL